MKVNELTNEDIFEKVAGAIAEQLNIDADGIALTSRLIEDLRADSLDVVTMVMDLEQEFDIEIPDEELTQLKTVGDVVNFVTGLRA